MNIRDILLHFFFPVSCEMCGRPGKALCDECRIKMEVAKAMEKAIPEITAKILRELEKQNIHAPAPEPEPEVKPVPEPDAQEYISLMFEKRPLVRNIKGMNIYAASMYYSQIKALIHDFKYSGNKLLCQRLGRAMGKFFERPNADYIVPVPLHLNSERDYNQAEELAKGIAEIWGLEVLDAVKWSRDMSRRVGLSGQERLQLSPYDFRVTLDVQGLRVVLVDDVCTTGATLSCLASALRDAGAVVVCAYALASAGT